MHALVPERRTSRYAGSQADNTDLAALARLFQAALRAALESRVPETARQQFDVAVECFHQLESLALPAEQRALLRDAMEALAARFPTVWRVNTALGLSERASEARRVETQRELLGEALAVLTGGRGPDDPEREHLDLDELDSLAQQVRAHLATLAGPGEVVRSGAVGSAVLPVLVAPSREAGDQAAGAEVEALDTLADVALGADDATDAATPAAPPDAHVTLALGVLPQVHLAALGMGAQLVHELRIVHAGVLGAAGGATSTCATLRLTSEPALLSPVEIPVEALLAGQSLDLGGRRLALLSKYDPTLLHRLTERADGGVTATLTDTHGRELARAFAPWSLQPADTWPGLAAPPELLAAFVTPNDPALAGVLHRAAQRLNEATGSPALDGYQSGDAARVLAVVDAVHEALRDAELTYVEPPASFERSGQRVRFPREVLGTRLATCLDMALLAAAALEQAGLHTLVILVEGHALAGVWLKDDTFDVAALDDAARLAKRIALPELVVFDPTVVTARPSVGFDGARAAAEARLADRESFVMAVDVQRARRGGVRPLPSLVERSGVDTPGAGVPQRDGEGMRPKRDLEAELAAYLAARTRADEATEAPATRLDRWQRHLLDLSMRNRLLNASGRSKRVIPLLVADAALIEDRLAEGKTLRIEPRPGELDEAASGERSERERLERIAPLLTAAESTGALKSRLGADELEGRLVTLFREARTAIEEGGASSLYLALGFLVYREKGKAHSLRRAPLLLVPVELKRASVRRGYSLTPTGEETRVNVTLLEYLRRDHQIDVAGLDPLPQDERGVDVALAVRLLQHAVKDEAGWEVLPEAELGLYSFAKHLLWRDLRDRIDTLRDNRLVAHLVDRPRDPFPEPVAAPPPEELDARFGTGDVLAPLSYDSSQLSAILAAAAGRTFVLEGPPGTGKSQTIANLVAQSIAAGKSVLFVSEKMAALDVVHRRLQALGLGTACLELHSNKASKKGVLQQFGEALDEGRVRGARRRPWAELASESDDVRATLNGHVAALHTLRRTGESIHTALGRTVEVLDELRRSAGIEGRDAAAEPTQGPFSLAALRVEDPTSVDEGTLRGWRALLDELDVEARAALVAPEHPLLLVGRAEYSPLIEERTRAALRAFDAPASEFAAAARDLGAALGLAGDLTVDGPNAPRTAAGWDALAALAEARAALRATGEAVAECLADDAARAQVGRALERLGELAALEGDLGRRFRVAPATLDLAALEATRREMDGGNWFVRWRRKGALLKALRGIAREPRALDIGGAILALDAAARGEALRPEVVALAPAAQRLLGEAWRRALDERGTPGAAQLHAEARAQFAQVEALAVALSAYTAAVGSNAAAAARLVAAAGTPSATVIGVFRAARAAYVAASTALREAAVPHAAGDPDAPGGGAPDGEALGALAALQGLALTWRDRWSMLRSWARYQALRARVVAGGLSPAVRALESGALRAGRARPAFEAFFAHSFALHAISGDERLRAFDGRAHERTLERFVALDEERLVSAREEVRQRTAAARPKPGDAAAAARGSALGVLQRELTKKTRHLALRRLLSELGPLARELKPCFLMSPISVAQYLAPDNPPFDLVVFDEASQIPVWDAIGVLARGSQAVIVGDPKQLPPTSFFDRADTGDEDEADDEELVQDLESILDECLAAQVPSHRLTWHYRSRDERLIAFSNGRYYDGQLRTFPASGSASVGLGLRFIEGGTYDKGRSRTNVVEARAVVDEVVRRLTQSGTGARARSIGVVTFSQAQQTLVLDLLDEAQRQRPELEAAFADSQDEPVFVKNLENVQGDERDVIIFSIGYGPDASGKVSMNFGPLNKDGGERRLNVAVTRARQELVVFTSLRSNQIDLARTGARGVHDLRAFLRYAEEVSAPDAAAGAGAASDPLVASIAARLVERGWEVATDVGRSDVRVDLAVRDPADPSRFVLGVVTDGVNHARFATARDRDRLQGEVLAGLGWHLARVHAIDWWRDADAELARLAALLPAPRPPGPEGPRGALVT